ncbi:anthrone oxygenase family protein [Streptomyces sp. NPDC002990]
MTMTRSRRIDHPRAGEDGRAGGPTIENARLASLIAATLTMGLINGLFHGFSVPVTPGLKRTDDRTVIQVTQRINVAILNGWFPLGYIGAFLSTTPAPALHIPPDGREVLPPLAAALVCYILSMGVTNKVNIPLNNALEKAGPAGRITDPAAVRRAFEGPWARANLWRTLLYTTAAGFLARALYLHGHNTRPPSPSPSNKPTYRTPIPPGPPTAPPSTTYAQTVGEPSIRRPRSPRTVGLPG